VHKLKIVKCPRENYLMNEGTGLETNFEEVVLVLINGNL
jgi:hypothetical protein